MCTQLLSESVTGPLNSINTFFQGNDCMATAVLILPCIYNRVRNHITKSPGRNVFILRHMVWLISDLHIQSFLFIFNGGLSPQVPECAFHLCSLGTEPVKGSVRCSLGIHCLSSLVVRKQCCLRSNQGNCDNSTGNWSIMTLVATYM